MLHWLSAGLLLLSNRGSCSRFIVVIEKALTLPSFSSCATLSSTGTLPNVGSAQVKGSELGTAYLVNTSVAVSSITITTLTEEEQ